MWKAFQSQEIGLNKVEKQLYVDENHVIMVNFLVQTITQRELEQQRAGQTKTQENFTDDVRGDAQNEVTKI